MKRIALIGSISSTTTRSYFEVLNREVRKVLGNAHTPELFAFLPDAAELAELYRSLRWDALRSKLIRYGRCAVGAGADAILLGGAAINPVAEKVSQAIGVPTISMTRAVGDALNRFKFERVAFVGVRTEQEMTMWQDAFGLEATFFPDSDKNELLLRIAENAVDIDEYPEEWHLSTTRIVASLRRSGAQAVVLCAPELNPLLREGRTLLPVIDAGETHAWVAAERALGADTGECISHCG